jgi:hypothetical protein
VQVPFSVLKVKYYYADFSCSYFKIDWKFKQIGKHHNCEVEAVALNSSSDSSRLPKSLAESLPPLSRFCVLFLRVSCVLIVFLLL